MGTSINDMRKRFAAVNLKHEAQASVEETKDDIKVLNIHQLMKGQRQDGSFLPDYSKTSVNVFGKEPGPIKLFETGDFYRGIKATVGPELIKIDSSDEKSDMLKERYKKGQADIFGLTDESKNEYVAELRPVFVKRMREKLKL